MSEKINKKKSEHIGIKNKILSFLPSNIIIISGGLLGFLILNLIISGIFYKIGVENLPVYYLVLFQFIISTFVFLIYIFFVGYPLHKILKEIQNLVSGGEFKDIEFKRNDEIGKISHFINQVIKRVKGLSGEIHEGKRVLGELNTAAQIQESTMPTSVPDGIIGLDIIAKTKSSSEIGGDCFDIIQQGKNTLIYLGDVTGHGVPAALVMMMANVAIKTLADNNLDSRDIFKKTNELLFEKIKTNHFMSSVMLRWDNERQKMYYTGAGHETIIHFSKKTGKVVNIKTGGIAIKMVKDISKLIKEQEIDFEEGDSLVLYSDGITEAKNQKDERYGLDGLTDIIEKNGNYGTSLIFDNFTKDYSEFVGQTQQDDDVTFIIIKNIGQYSGDPILKVGASKENSQGISGTEWDWN